MSSFFYKKCKYFIKYINMSGIYLFIKFATFTLKVSKLRKCRLYTFRMTILLSVHKTQFIETRKAYMKTGAPFNLIYATL